MKFLPTAFAQLEFMWKLYDYACEGGLKVDELDRPITFQDKGMVLVLRDRIFDSQDDLVIACENMLNVAFGAAAITLNRCREEAGIAQPNPITTELDQFVALVYQVRNAFAHDIAEPRWDIRNPRYDRTYSFGPVNVDLRGKHGQLFNYADLGGPEVLFWMKEFGDREVWPGAP